MSRRREAADLARALALSTQEAKIVSKLPPHRLSSSNPSSTATQDSKEMELRPTHLAASDHGGAMYLTPRVGTGTVRPEDVMRPPTLPGTSGTRTGTESIDVSPTSGSGVSARQTSYIQSFPPTIPPGIIVPATDSAARAETHSGSSSNGHRLPSSSGNSSNPLIPSSFGHRRQPTSSNPAPSPAFSSPLPQAIAGPSHVSSTELSSNRPLFSSTQGSANPVSHAESWSRVPPIVRTYGRSTRTPSPSKKSADVSGAERIVLSSSPVSDIDALVPARRSASPVTKSKVILSSDEEEEEEEEEQIESRPPLRTPVVSSRSKVEVVLPRSRPSSAIKERRAGLDDTSTLTRRERERHHSPDLLDILGEHDRTPAKAGPSSSVQPPSSVMTNSTRAGSAIPSEGSRRASSRVAINKEKAEKEKEERRRKRREEKEKNKLAQELKIARDNGKSTSPVEDTAPTGKPESKKNGSTEEPIEIEESIVEVAPPPRVLAESSTRKRKSDAIDLDFEDVGDGRDGDFDFDPVAEEKEKEKANPKARVKAAPKAKKGKKVTPKRGKKAETVPEPEPEAEPGPGPEVGEVIEVELPHEERADEPEAEAEKEKEKEKEKEEEEEDDEAPAKSPPPKAVSPSRPPLRSTSSNTPESASGYRPSPGPARRDGSPMVSGGIKWKAPRNDLSSVLAKFGGAKRSGMSKRLRIAPLHQTIGPPAKALPPAPKKAEKKKKGEDDDDEEDEEGNPVKRDDKKGIEWFMVED